MLMAGCILRLRHIDYLLWDGFVLPSHDYYYARLLLMIGCIGCTILRSKPNSPSLDLISIGKGLSMSSGTSTSSSALWDRVCICVLINNSWRGCTRLSLSLFAGSIGYIIINCNVSLIVEWMESWLELFRGRDLFNGFMLPSHWMWYNRLLIATVPIGHIIMRKQVSLLLELMNITSWLSASCNILWSRCRMSIHWIRCNTRPLHSFLRSIDFIALIKQIDVVNFGLSALLSSLDNFIIIVESGKGTHVKVDPSCKYLGERAFRGNTNVVHVQLSEGLESLGSTVFRDCSSLKRINIPSTVKVVGKYAFRGCKQLRVVGLRKGLERIGDGSFVDCASLERIYIPDTVRVLGDWTFCSCRRLLSVDLPEGLQHIGKWTFYDCTSLRRIKVPSTVQVIEEMAFINCVNLKKVELCNGLVHIANHAFSSCTSIKQMRIPSSVKSIGEVAFVNCTNLERVELSEGLEEIGVEAFLDCKSLLRINIPSTIKVIRERTFRGCRILVDVEVGEGVEKIMECAFNSCMSLPRIKIPKSGTYIHPQAFHHCPRLTEVRFCDEVDQLVREASIESWWNHGVSDLALRTYSLLVEYGIPDRLMLIKATNWRGRIHSMVERIPTIESQCLKEYVHSIDSKLSSYERAKDIASVLELAVWKANIITMVEQQCDHTNTCKTNISYREMKSGCRITCGATVIIPHVLSFLV